MSSIFEYVTETATRSLHKPAISVGGQEFSYDALLSAAEKVCTQLRICGLFGAKRMIALAAESTFTGFASLLGILASGNAYVPLNPRWPDSRIRSVWRRARPA